MTVRRYEMIDYLVKEQGYDEDMVSRIPLERLVELYGMYHED